MKTKTIKSIEKNLDYYMSLNYTITLEEFDDNGITKYGLNIPDLPGIWSSGTTLDEAHNELEDTKRLWFETCIEKGIEIIEPISDEDFSGKFILRLDPRLHMSLHKSALKNKNSLNQHIRNLLEHQIDNVEIINYLKDIDHKISLIEKKIDSLGDVVSSYLKPTVRSEISYITGGITAILANDTAENYDAPIVAVGGAKASNFQTLSKAFTFINKTK
ncbi:MAG: type II toxin-antitoxin system HicB family antitoxin [Smithella sp.]|jgi:antitoxin HicB